MAERASLYNDIYSREVVMARVGHLIRRKQQEIERITRIIRSAFTGEGVLAPTSAKIKKIVLIGPYARRTWVEDKHTIGSSDYEFWIVVNHPLFKDETLWETTEELIHRELGMSCAVSMSVFSKQDIRTAKARRDTYILDRLEAGITLFQSKRDAPLLGRTASHMAPKVIVSRMIRCFCRALPPI